MSHHPSCRPADNDLIWFCAQCGERESAEEISDALKEARATIYALHGEVAWPEYQHSPEMKRINAAIAKLSA